MCTEVMTDDPICTREAYFSIITYSEIVSNFGYHVMLRDFRQDRIRLICVAKIYTRSCLIGCDFDYVTNLASNQIAVIIWSGL